MRSFRLSEMSPRHLTSSDSIYRPTLSLAPISIIGDATSINSYWLEPSYQDSMLVIACDALKNIPLLYYYGTAQYDMGKIWVNGAIKRQWTRGRKESQQVTTQCKNIIGKESIWCKDVIEHLFGSNSPLFDTWRWHIEWNHCNFFQVVSTGMQLSTNQ